jgi:hypothetical protein
MASYSLPQLYLGALVVSSAQSTILISSHVIIIMALCRRCERHLMSNIHNRVLEMPSVSISLVPQQRVSQIQATTQWFR